MIAERELHIWTAQIDTAPIDAMLPLLDDDERARVARFRFEDDQRRAVVARATLRALLGNYLDRAPRDFRFVLGPQGKPSLPDTDVEFNVSHSGRFVVLAFAQGSPVGVDVETEKRTNDILGIAERFFSVPEADVVRSASDVAAAFYKTWTAKESVIKALGGGLSIDLKSFRVVPEREFTAVENLEGWFVQTLPAPAEGYHAAVAIRGAEWTTVVREADGILAGDP